MKNRSVSLLILFAFLIPLLVSCGGEAAPAATDAAETSAAVAENETETQPAAETVPETEPLTSNVPDDVDLEGMVVSLLHVSDVMFRVEEDDGEVVNSAIIARNRDVEEKLNCSFTTTEHDYKIEPVIRKQIQAGDTSLNLYSGTQWIVAPCVLNGYFVNLLNTGLDFSSDWWATGYIEEAAVGTSARFFCSGDITLNMLQAQSCAFFNKQVYADLFGDPSEMYETVLDGKWTLDKLASMGTTVYSDLNGNGEADDADRYNLGVHYGNLTEHIAFDAGYRVTERNGDNVPVITVGSEKSATLMEKMYSLFYENTGTHSFVPSAETNDVTIPAKFKNNEILFDLGWLSTADFLRDMEGDFGLIPYPKYDEAQDRYLSLVADHALVYAIPVTCTEEEAEQLACVLEEMAFLAWRDVMPAYYDVALKVKYVRDSDDVAMRIVDMVHDGATTDFGFIYNYALENIGNIMRYMMRDMDADFASRWAAIETTVNAEFDELVGLYQSLK